MPSGSWCWVWSAITSSGWPTTRRTYSVVLTATARSGGRNQNISSVPTCPWTGPSTTANWWPRDSGAGRDILTTQEIWWAPWPIAWLVGLTTSCLISTSFIWLFCWPTAALGMNTVVSANTGRTGSATLLPCLTGSYQEYFKTNRESGGKKKENLLRFKKFICTVKLTKTLCEGHLYCSEGEKVAEQ